MGLAILCLLGTLPAILPGLVALGMRRRILGTTLAAGAVAVVMGLSILGDLHQTEDAARGVYYDDIATAFAPIIVGILYMIASGVLLLVFVVVARLSAMLRRR